MIALDDAAQTALLGRRPEEVLTPSDRAMLAGQRLLITGAGGSVGAELCRQVAASRPALLTLFDYMEYNLFRIESELRDRFPDVPLQPLLGDVTRRTDLQAACRLTRPDAVYHAAACKHVPIAERSILTATRTNVLGTYEAVRAAREAGARFVLISSDKAAEPRSVMGATKRLAEFVALGYSSASFRPLVVRFGNILGSSGSVVEIMLRCVQEGRRIPVTSPDATRFFMTASEAASLVIKADMMGRRAEVFWLDMGEPMRIGELADRVIAWATPAGRPSVGIDIIGLRPGEKMREELTSQGLEMRPTSHPRVWVARQEDVTRCKAVDALRGVRHAVRRGDALRTLELLKRVVGDFEPSDAAVAAAGAAFPSLTRTRRRLLTAV